MPRRLRAAVVVAATCLVFAGCSSSSAGVTLSARPSASASSLGGPSVSAKMICTETEISNAITLTLGLKSAPAKNSEWVEPVFHCTYLLPQGPLKLTVTEFPTVEAAVASFNKTEAQYEQNKSSFQSLDALGVPSFLAGDDLLISIKTSHLLRVDASQLPKTVGPLHRSRRDLSYLVASAILKCWSGA